MVVIDNNNIYNNFSTTNPIYVSNTGNVGIGTNNPGTNLDVLGGIKASNGLTIAGGTINFTGATFTTSSIPSNAISGTLSQWTTLTPDIYFSGGKVAIGSSSAPTATLDVTGNIRASTGLTVTAGGLTVSADGLTVPSGQLVTLNDILVRSFNKTLSSTVNYASEICTLTATNGALTFYLNVVHSEPNSSESRTYFVSSRYSATGDNWYRLNPLYSSGTFNSNDWGVDIKVNFNEYRLRLVRIATGASTNTSNFNCTITVFQSSSNKVTIADSLITSTSAETNNGIFSGTPITQVGGNVGIGNAAPTTTLHITTADPGVSGQGCVLIDSPNINKAGGCLVLRNSSGGIGAFASIAFGVDSTSNTNSNTNTPNDFNAANAFLYAYNTNSSNATRFGLRLWSGSAHSEVQTWMPTGEVGIGTDTPTSGYKLDVIGKIRASDDITAFSDRRLKTNIENIDNPLDKLEKMHGYYYIRSDLEDKKRCVGVIAQELLEVLPEVVSKGTDDKVESFYSVSYGNITAFLIEALKEEVAHRKALSEEVKELKKHIEYLTNSIDKLLSV